MWNFPPETTCCGVTAELHANFVFVFQSGEAEPLDLGLPISNLDGLRVVLERAEPSASNGMHRSTPALLKFILMYSLYKVIWLNISV